MKAGLFRIISATICPFTFSLPLMKRLTALALLGSLLTGCIPGTDTGDSSMSVPSGQFDAVSFGADIPYTETTVQISPTLAADFSISEIENLDEMQEAYGFTLTAAERQALERNKFLMLPLTVTSIVPKMGDGATREWYREFIGLYNAVRGDFDYKKRTQANALFLSADIFFHSYNLLYTELLKEMENTQFAPSMKTLSQTFFQKASVKYDETSGEEQEGWRKVRNYFAVPYTLLSTAKQPLTPDDYMNGGGVQDPSALQASFSDDDKKADTIETATAFVNGLNLDAASKQEVLADLQMVYKADDKGVPAIFEQEYKAYAEDSGVQFMVDFTQFTPRSHYTGSSLRRQYFRSMMWFSQLPFFVKSAALTDYAFKATQLLAENPEQLSDYAKLESTVNFLVGTSDDLMPADYIEALRRAEGASNQEEAIMEYLAAARPPKIKNIAAAYPTVGDVQTSDVLLLTKGMRFFSGKFIIDSYWTGQLTQGDEAVKPGYTQKLPPMASSLEVMALLGSDYAESKIPMLDFYKPETKEAIDRAMNELKTETATFDRAFWTSNLYNGWLWTIQSLFAWQDSNKALLPRFMQSELWPAKTLMTAAGFWTELRHATLLYAKQSFAELGGGPGACDPRIVPQPPKGYIEPQMQAYDRLSYLAQRTEAGLMEIGFDDLRNMQPLSQYVDLLEKVKSYTQKQLANTTFNETITSSEQTDDFGTTCTVYTIEEGSDWETLRRGIVDGLEASLPFPVEGAVLPAKDKRSALIADVHTGGDSNNPPHILYEATGVPHLILVAVKDTNGPRLTVGFTYSQYEFTEPYGGQRLTDEQWQTRFYTGDDPYDAYQYTPRASWPKIPSWFAPLFTR